MNDKELYRYLQAKNITQKSLAKKFKCRPQQIYSAIHNGDQPTLRKKIINYLERTKSNENNK